MDWFRRRVGGRVRGDRGEKEVEGGGKREKGEDVFKEM